MKHLILYAITSLFLLSSCLYKKESSGSEEVKVKEGAIMECEAVKNFIKSTLQNPPKQPRAYIDKFLYKKQYVFFMEEGGEIYPDKMYTILNSQCEVVCYSGGIAGNVCEGFDKAEFVERIWKDER